MKQPAPEERTANPASAAHPASSPAAAPKRGDVAPLWAKPQAIKEERALRWALLAAVFVEAGLLAGLWGLASLAPTRDDTPPPLRIVLQEPEKKPEPAPEPLPEPPPPPVEEPPPPPVDKKPPPKPVPPKAPPPKEEMPPPEPEPLPPPPEPEPPPPPPEPEAPPPPKVEDHHRRLRRHLRRLHRRRNRRRHPNLWCGRSHVRCRCPSRRFRRRKLR